MMRTPIVLWPVLVALAVAPSRSVAAEVVRLGTLPGLRFDTREFSVRPGAEVEIVFSNTDEMLHNLVVTLPARREAVVQAALDLGTAGPERDFVPATPDVLWATKVVPSGQSATLKFTAPAAPGDYPYVCTFPGHGLMMFGTMVVTPTPRAPVLNPKEMPTVASPPMDHSAAHAATHARVQRFFMPQAGPASIAVVLPGGYSYCWDAGAGRFRYAWKGGLGERPERAVAKVEGEIYYREESGGFPLRIGLDPHAEPKQIEFKGYTLDARGVPEFEQVIDGVTIYERVEIEHGRIARRFRTNASAVWFHVPPEHSERFTAAASKEGDFYLFSGAAAKDFTVIYTPLNH